MESKSAPETNERLAVSYSKLWDSGLSLPDVFAFLGSHPEVPNIDRLDVLLVDQQERWRRAERCRCGSISRLFPTSRRGEKWWRFGGWRPP